MPGPFFNSLIYRALGGMARRKTGCFRVRIPRTQRVEQKIQRNIFKKFLNMVFFMVSPFIRKISH
jgi:hypothetical protein